MPDQAPDSAGYRRPRAQRPAGTAGADGPSSPEQRAGAAARQESRCPRLPCPRKPRTRHHRDCCGTPRPSCPHVDAVPGKPSPSRIADRNAHRLALERPGQTGRGAQPRQPGTCPAVDHPRHGQEETEDRNAQPRAVMPRKAPGSAQSKCSPRSSRSAQTAQSADSRTARTTAAPQTAEYRPPDASAVPLC